MSLAKVLRYFFTLLRSTIGAGELGFQVSEQSGKVHFYILERMKEGTVSVFGIRTGVPYRNCTGCHDFVEAKS